MKTQITGEGEPADLLREYALQLSKSAHDQSTYYSNLAGLGGPGTRNKKELAKFYEGKSIAFKHLAEVKVNVKGKGVI